MSIAAARALLRVGQFSGAERLALIVLQKTDSAELWRIVGLARDRQGRREGALYALERCIALEPGNVLAHIDYGALLLEHGQAEKALAAAERAVAIDANSALAWYNKARAHEALGGSAAAAAAFERASALAPGPTRPA